MTRLPHNPEEARAWAKLKGTHERERRCIGKAYLLGYRDKPPGAALLIPQKLHDDAWRLGRKCKQYEQREASTRHPGASGENKHPRRTFRAPQAELYAQDVAAKAAGITWTEWMIQAAREKRSG